MVAVLLIARAELRRRARSLVLLAALVALVVAVVLATAAGAHRTATALDRFRSHVAADDASVWATGSTRRDAAEQIASVPGVEKVGTTNMYSVIADTEFDATVVSSPDGSSFDTIDRPLLLSGRMPATDAPNEVALSELAVRYLGVGVGDRLSLRTFGADQWLAFTSGAAPFPSSTDGPVLDLTVVGTARVGTELQGSAKDAGPILIASPAFASTYEGKAAHVGTTFPMNLTDGADVVAVADQIGSLDLGSYRPIQMTTIEDQWVTTTAAAVNVVAVALVVFSIVAGVAGLVAIGQGVVRQLSSGSEVVVTSTALGLTRAERAAAIALPSVLASIVGSLIGVLVASLASPLFPLAPAWRVEPTHGIRFDGAVLVGGWIVAVVVLCLWSLLMGWRRAGMTSPLQSDGRTRPRRWLGLGSGATVPSQLGARLALDRDRSIGRLPVRTTIAGVMVAVAGVAGVAVFVASVESTLDRPDRWGWTWSSAPDVYPTTGPDGQETSMADGLKAAAGESDLSAVGVLLGRQVSIGGAPINAVAFDTIKGSIAPAVVEGRLPSGPGEIALGGNTMRLLHKAEGDTVVVSTDDGRQLEMEVVGQSVQPLFNNSDPGGGAVLAPATFADLAGMKSIDELLASDKVDLDYDANVLLRYRDGVDRTDLEGRLSSTYGVQFSVYSRPQPPGRLHNLRAVEPIAWWLGGFFVLLGVVGLTHALVVTVRRRGKDMAVYEAFGMVRRQVRRVVTGQSVTVACCGLLIGVPLGVVLGRATWALSIRNLGMLDTPTRPDLALVGVAVVGVVLAVLVALPPGWLATRHRPAQALRSE